MYCGAGIHSIAEWAPNWALPPLKIKRGMVETLCQGDLLPCSSSHCRAVFHWSMKYFFLKIQPKSGQDDFWVNLSLTQPSPSKEINFLKNKQADPKQFLFVALLGGLEAHCSPHMGGKAEPRQGSAWIEFRDKAEGVGLDLCDKEIRLRSKKA